MKISASIYSDKKRDLKIVIEDLVQHQVDLLHIDCNDDLSVFEDIKKIREWCDLPIDLHIITSEPQKYYPFLIENPVEYLTFQFEDLNGQKLEIPDEVSGKKGIAIITPTSVDIFQEFEDFDFILIMATIPGQSGGKFDVTNFNKIRKFRKLYPSKSIHVDGGVNGEVSFILRNMGVSSSVSGSYLFNAPSIGHALMNLTKREVDSSYLVKDFMIPLEESPFLLMKDISFENVLKSVDDGKIGFSLVIDEINGFKGLISNADIRKGLLQNIENLNQINPLKLINENPVVIDEEATVNELLKKIKHCTFPVSYLPVVDKKGKAKGILTFVNLIKGEL